MKRHGVLLLFGFFFVIVTGGIVRDKRQAWHSFLDRRQPMQMAANLGLQEEGKTSTKPPGVIFQLTDCSCPSPPQYNPVCGTDGNTYANRQKLECAKKCGYSVDEVRIGACDS